MKHPIKIALICAMVSLTGTARAGESPAAGQPVPSAGESRAAPSQSPAERPVPLFQRVVKRARALAGQPYEALTAELPASLANLDYQGYRNIRFRKDQALWADESAFSVEFFHPGFLYQHPVTVYEVVDGEPRMVDFDPDLFHYGDTGRPADVPRDLGFAGFRVHYPLHNAAYKDELVAFLGASYFRVVGRGQHYGLSARGLAVDTAVRSGEEFPRFDAFWLVKPSPESNHLTVYALLDSPSVTGAYEMIFRVESNTVVDVRKHLFARAAVSRLGIAPLTSMYAWGENDVREPDDYRPEVHDSDGLLQHKDSGEWIWRPLVNPPALQVSALLDGNPRGFGLLQRDRRFDHYQDAESRYERRPGIWITPGDGDWGSGAVQLIEIPTEDETNDNIVAFWVPDERFDAGDSRYFEYRMRTVERLTNPDGLAEVTDTFTGWGWVPGSPNPPPRSLRQFVIDFRGEALEGLAADQPIEAELTVSRGEAREVTVSRLPDGSTWRVAFKLSPETREETVDMRLHLKLRGRRISETWSYLWNPKSIS